MLILRNSPFPGRQSSYLPLSGLRLCVCVRMRRVFNKPQAMPQNSKRRIPPGILWSLARELQHDCACLNYIRMWNCVHAWWKRDTCMYLGPPSSRTHRESAKSHYWRLSTKCVAGCAQRGISIEIREQTRFIALFTCELCITISLSLYLLIASQTSVIKLEISAAAKKFLLKNSAR